MEGYLYDIYGEWEGIFECFGVFVGMFYVMIDFVLLVFFFYEKFVDMLIVYIWKYIVFVFMIS